MTYSTVDPSPAALLTLTPAVYIVGAGPGDPELLTVKAQKILQQADVILYADSLVPKAMVRLAKADAEVIPTSTQTLEDILPVMIERVRSQNLSSVFILVIPHSMGRSMNKCRR